MNRVSLQRLSRLRFTEANALYRLKLYSGAYYLAGYSVECALKACIAKGTKRYDFPDKVKANKSYVHNPVELVAAGNLTEMLNTARRESPKLQASWNVVNTWSEQSRYTVWERADAQAMITAVGNPEGGVLSWIERHW